MRLYSTFKISRQERPPPVWPAPASKIASSVFFRRWTDLSWSPRLVISKRSNGQNYACVLELEHWSFSGAWILEFGASIHAHAHPSQNNFQTLPPKLRRIWIAS